MEARVGEIVLPKEPLKNLATGAVFLILLAMPTVLVVEDDVVIQRLIEFKLIQEGYTVVMASDGEEGFSKAEQSRPDLIILDVMMPAADGFEVLRRIKAHDGLKETPVLMLTSRKKDKDIETGLDLGAAEYMVKPFSPRELIARVKKALNAA